MEATGSFFTSFSSFMHCNVDNESHVQRIDLNLQECLKDVYYFENIEENSIQILPGAANESFSEEPTIQDASTLQRNPIESGFFLTNYKQYVIYYICPFLHS